MFSLNCFNTLLDFVLICWKVCEKMKPRGLAKRSKSMKVWYKLVELNCASEHGKYKNIWLKSLHVVSKNQGCRFSVIFHFFCYFWPNPKNTCMLIFSIFSYFIFLFLNFLSLFVFIFCEMACTRRFSVTFAKVPWHPWTMPMTSIQDQSVMSMPELLQSFCCEILSQSRYDLVCSQRI